MSLYNSLPQPPDRITSANILKRLVDGMGFRFRLATEDLTEADYTFRPVESSMSIKEVQKHIFHLVRLSAHALNANLKDTYKTESPDEVRKSILEICVVISEHLNLLADEELEKKKIYLKRTDTNYSFWYLINGFLADALTHIGQINSWRRMAGNPVGRVSPFTGDPY